MQLDRRSNATESIIFKCILIFWYPTSQPKDVLATTHTCKLSLPLCVGVASKLYIYSFCSSDPYQEAGKHVSQCASHWPYTHHHHRRYRSSNSYKTQMSLTHHTLNADQNPSKKRRIINHYLLARVWNPKSAATFSLSSSNTICRFVNISGYD